MKKPKKEYKFIERINCGIFPANIAFIYNYDNYQDIIKDLDKEWKFAISADEELINTSDYLVSKRLCENKVTKEKRIYFYLFIKSRFTFTDYEYCKLAHEVVHLCQFILEDFLDRDEEHECEAYLHTHIMCQALKLLRK